MSAFRVPEIAELRELREVGRTVGYNGIHIYLRYRAVLSILAGVRAKRVLIVGCGYGIFDRLLPEDLEVVGIDTSEREIAFASEWARAHRPGWRYERKLLDALAPAPASFDLAVLSEVVEHVPEPEVPRMLRTACDALAPGGHLLVTVPNRLHLRNRTRRLFGRPLVLMDPTHLREYDRASARRLMDGLPVEVSRFEAAVLYFPLEPRIARVLPPESPIRERILKTWPGVASHFLLLGKKRSA